MRASARDHFDRRRTSRVGGDSCVGESYRLTRFKYEQIKFSLMSLGRNLGGKLATIGARFMYIDRRRPPLPTSFIAIGRCLDGAQQETCSTALSCEMRH